MTLYKIAKSIARKTGEDVEEVYQRFVKNRKKLRRMEGIHAKSDQERSKFHSPQPLDKHERFPKTYGSACN